MHLNMSYNIVHKPSQLSKGALQLQKSRTSLHNRKSRLWTRTGGGKLRDPRHTAPAALTTLDHSTLGGTFGQKCCPSVNHSTPAPCKILGSTTGCGLQSSGHRGSRWMKCSESLEVALIVHPASEKLRSHYLLSLM